MSSCLRGVHVAGTGGESGTHCRLYPNLGQTHLEQKVAKLVCLLMRNGFVDNESDAFNAPSWRSVAVLGTNDFRIQGHLLRSFLPGEDPHTVLSESLHGLVQILLRIISSLLAGVL
jgi:hypothetical protein